MPNNAKIRDSRKAQVQVAGGWAGCGGGTDERVKSTGFLRRRGWGGDALRVAGCNERLTEEPVEGRWLHDTPWLSPKGLEVNISRGHKKRQMHGSVNSRLASKFPPPQMK